MENAWRVYASGFGNFDVFDEVETSWLSVGILGGLGALPMLRRESKMTCDVQLLAWFKLSMLIEFMCYRKAELSPGLSSSYGFLQLQSSIKLIKANSRWPWLRTQDH